MFWRELTWVELVGLAAGLVALVGMALALLTAHGREALALLGLRVADALVVWLEGRLKPATRAARRLKGEG